jgi:hypothetical protein
MIPRVHVKRVTCENFYLSSDGLMVKVVDLLKLKASGFEFEPLWAQNVSKNVFLGKMFEKHSKVNIKIR